jgi:hypothetical protein
VFCCCYVQFVFLGFALCSCSLFVNVVLVLYLRGFLLGSLLSIVFFVLDSWFLVSRWLVLLCFCS